MRTVSIAVSVPANTNASSPEVELRPTGDGSVLYRTLARVLVRRELKFASAIPQDGDCEPTKTAG
jgi:hypothetical protein